MTAPYPIPETVFILTVDGGDVETFKGVFRTRDALDAVMVEEAFGKDSGRDEEYILAEPEIDEEGRECIYLHHCDNDPYNCEMAFYIRTAILTG
jgi:hypothetical protein